MKVLKIKEGEKLPLIVRETITFSGYLGMLTDFCMLSRG